MLMGNRSRSKPPLLGIRADRRPPPIQHRNHTRRELTEAPHPTSAVVDRARRQLRPGDGGGQGEAHEPGLRGRQHLEPVSSSRPPHAETASVSTVTDPQQWPGLGHPRLRAVLRLDPQASVSRRRDKSRRILCLQTRRRRRSSALVSSPSLPTFPSTH